MFAITLTVLENGLIAYFVILPAPECTLARLLLFFLAHCLFLPCCTSPDGQKKAYVRLAPDTDALDVANRIGII